MNTLLKLAGAVALILLCAHLMSHPKTVHRVIAFGSDIVASYETNLAPLMSDEAASLVEKAVEK